MTTTLILRDVTLAVNGAPEVRGELAPHLEGRVEVVQAFEPAAIQECIEVLLPSASGEQASAEVLQALLLLAMAHPDVCKEFGVSATALGRQLAGELEGSDRGEDAVQLLELLCRRYPGSRALERALAGLMRRRGLAQDLEQRYMDRANRLLKAGRTAEAIDSLREVLLLNRSRKDVARMIRDLRYQELDQNKGRRRRVRTAIGVLLASGLATMALLREGQVTSEYYLLPSAEVGNLDVQTTRLAALDEFAERNPVWHRAMFVMKERSDLRIEVDRLALLRAEQQEAQRAKLAQRLEAANLARERGLLRAGSGDYQTALQEFRRSLELASPEWPPRDRVERDIEAITAWLEGNE